MTDARRSDSDLDALADMEKDGREICEHVGHDWGDAGGDLLICTVCTAEKWALSPDGLTDA
jgi:hypothetical protein